MISPQEEARWVAFDQGEADSAADRENSLHQYADPHQRIAYNLGYNFGCLVRRGVFGPQR